MTEPPYRVALGLAADGVSQSEIARLLGVSQPTVSRMLAGAQADAATTPGAMTQAVDRLVASLGDLDPEAALRAQALRVTAQKFDWASAASTGAAAAATASLMRELDNGIGKLLALRRPPNKLSELNAERARRLGGSR